MLEKFSALSPATLMPRLADMPASFHLHAEEHFSRLGGGGVGEKEREGREKRGKRALDGWSLRTITGNAFVSCSRVLPSPKYPILRRN